MFFSKDVVFVTWGFRLQSKDIPVAGTFTLKAVLI